MTTTFASGRNILPFSSSNITITSDGSLGVTGTYYISIQGQNRVGLNLNSALVSCTLTSTSKITIDLTTLLLDGEDWQNIVISASTTNDVSTLTQIVSIRVADLNTPIILSSSQIFKLTTSDRTVANPAALPSLTVNENGLVRYVSSLNYFYQYDRYSTKTVDDINVLSATTGRWIRIGSVNTYITDTTGADGCDQDVRTPNLSVTIPDYAVDGSKGQSVTYWIRNDLSEIIPSGTRLSGIVRLGEEDKSQLFDSLLIVEIVGYIDLSTGVIDTSIASGEILYSPNINPIVLPEDLESNHAVVVEVSPKFRPEQLNNEVSYLANLSFYITFGNSSGTYAPGSKALGNVIYSEFDRLHILPGDGNTVVRKKGSGIILGYELIGIAEEEISVSSNTDDQYIYLTSNGSSLSDISGDLEFAVIRAKVGTLDGIANAYSYGNVTLDNTKRLSVVVNYPTIIRTDYQDNTIAGLSTTYFNATNVVIYIKNSTNNYFKYEGNITPNSNSDTFVLNNSDFSTTTLLTNENNFGLFKPSTVTVTTPSTSSGFTSGTYEVLVAFKYTGVVTSIDHSVSQLVELPSNLAELLDSISTQWYTGTTVPDSELGIANDLYLRTTTGDVYKKIGDTWTIIANIKGADGTATNSFNTISVSGQSDVIAESATDTLTLVAGDNITITTNATTDTITINSTGGSGGGGVTPIQFIDSNYTAVNGDRLLVVLDYLIENNDITITLPASPEPGWEIEILFRNDYGLYTPPSELDTVYNPRAFINRNGNNFMGYDPSIILLERNYNETLPHTGVGGKLVYVNSDIGWYIIPPATVQSFLLA